MMRSAAHAPVDLVAAVVVYTLFWVGVTVAPLLHFTPLLLRAKRRGLVAYGQLGDALFRAFDEKWTTPDTSGQQRLLGNPDPSSLADYGYAYEVVAGMRAVPIGLSGRPAVSSA